MQEAIANIVSRFERPANPGGEIARALAAYGINPSSAAPMTAGQVQGAAPDGAPQPLPRQPASPPDFRQQIATALGSGKPVDWLALALAKRRMSR